MDEGRFGLKVGLKRRWCPRGVRPPWVVEDHFEWCWLYVAVEPTSGDSLWLLMPGVDRLCFEAFLVALARQVGDDTRVGLVLDGSGTHRAGTVRWPTGIGPLPLPPYSPELNPVELFFRHLHAVLSNRIFTDLAELEEAITVQARTFWDEPARVRQLAGFGWWLEGVTAILPPAA